MSVWQIITYGILIAVVLVTPIAVSIYEHRQRKVLVDRIKARGTFRFVERDGETVLVHVEDNSVSP